MKMDFMTAGKLRKPAQGTLGEEENGVRVGRKVLYIIMDTLEIPVVMPIIPNCNEFTGELKQADYLLSPLINKFNKHLFSVY